MEYRLQEMWKILRHVSAYYGVDVEDLLGRSRPAGVSTARQVAMHLMYETHNEIGMPRIGRFFGRNHSTVIYARRRIQGLVDVSDAVRGDVEILQLLIDT